MHITRRTFGLATLGGIAAPALLASFPTSAKAPLAGAQVPGVYRLKVGTMEVTVLNDGWLPLGAKLYSGTPEGAERLLASAFLQPDAVKTSVNEWLVNTGDKLVLIDAGTSNVYLPTLGRMSKNLAAAGVEPGAVDAVIISHMHPDHVAGLLTEDKKVAFPNATVHVAEPEYAFWTSAEIAGKAPKEAKPFFDIAQAAVKPYADAGRVVQFKDGAELAGYHRCRGTGTYRGPHDVPPDLRQRDDARLGGHRPQCGPAVPGAGACHRLGYGPGDGDLNA
jgi:glyoxylase-like metal-dependent hydrolase (beta-lactamase superfamily II)